MILSIDAEKGSDKIQNPFKIKTLQKAGKEGTYLNIVKATYNKPTATNILKGGKTENISSRNKTRVPTLTTIIQPNFQSPSQGNQRRKRNKKNPNWKRRSKIVTVYRWYDTDHFHI